MNNFMYRVKRADIPVIYIVVSVHMHVKCVIGHSVKRIIYQHINAYIVERALLFVIYVIRHTFTRVTS